MWTIGDVAGHFGLATHVLRHWESRGLLAPRRLGSDRRRYVLADFYRVAAIMQAKAAGFELDDIRQILAATDPDDRASALRRQRDDLRARLDQLRASLDLVERAIDCRHADIAACPNLQSVLAARVKTTPLPQAVTFR